jgi:hypothetical protein
MSGPYHGDLKAPFAPVAISDLECSIPTKTRHLMPAMEDIPEEFTRRRSPWNDVFTKWFYQGFDARQLRAKPGIDRKAAIRHLSGFMGSWEPPHEHKEAAAAFLMSLWFEPLPVAKKHKQKAS